MKIGPKYKICRRLGSRVFGKCQTTKFAISGSETKTGGKSKRGGGRPKALSEYGTQLIEKQKARYAYGLKEGQFANYIKSLKRHHAATPAATLYSLLERRLDNVVYRFGWASTRPLARQLVSHGHITVNGRRVNIPSYQVKPGDKVAVRPASRTIGVFRDLAERLKNYRLPAWLSADEKEGEVKAAPVFGETEGEVNFGAIIEFYSRV